MDERNNDDPQREGRTGADTDKRKEAPEAGVCRHPIDETGHRLYIARPAVRSVMIRLSKGSTFIYSVPP